MRTLTSYNGLFLDEIAKKRGMDWFDNTMDFAQKSKGLANSTQSRLQ